MESTSIDKESTLNFTNEEIWDAFTFLFSTESENLGSKRIQAIGELLRNVLDAELQNAVLELLSQNHIDIENHSTTMHELSITKPNYTESDIAKISALIYSIKFIHSVCIDSNNTLNAELEKLNAKSSLLSAELPQLNIRVEGRAVKHDVMRCIAFLQKKTSFFLKAVAETINFSEGRDLLDNMISKIYEIEYLDNGNGQFNQDIAYLKQVRENLRENNTLDNLTHNETFVGNGYQLWKHIEENYISNGYRKTSDIAYFYWRMSEGENPIIHVRPEAFKRWYHRVTRNAEPLGQFKQLSVLRTDTRERNYNTALALFKSNR